MYLKSLEVQGFKSFANRIVFQFHNGITGVVGPNGSGKSNVSDAIRWVLGEQSAKSLRGGSMQDVIFSGTQARKAMSYAYVAITMDNSDHALPVSYEEVTVARRLYRSGESEYLINGTACRMRDIQELFYDTGIGKEGYSLIGQGQVEKILNGKPEERRELFDEAAGIVKFKHRKNAALKKLENEQNNLVRVSDILSELDRQVGPLKRQSETAKVYLAKREELKTLDVNLFLIDADRFDETLAQTKQKLTDAQSQMEETQNQLLQAKQQYEDLGTQLRDIGEEVTAVNEDLGRCRVDRQQTAGRIDLIDEQIQALNASDEQLKVRSGKIQGETALREEQLGRARQRRQDLSEEEEKLTGEQKSRQDSFTELQDRIAGLNESIESDKSEIIRILNDRTDIQTGRQRASTMIEQIALRQSQLSSMELTLSSEEKEQSASRQELAGRQTEAENEAEDLQARSERLNEELQKVHNAFLDASQDLEKLREEYQRESSRLDTLKAIAERYEGYGGSIRRVMEQKSREPGILGVVADLIKTEKKYELAIETALGGSIQNIVTDNENTAKRMISFLKENRFGRATFLPLTAMKNSQPFKDRGALEETGVIGLASTLVSCEDRFRDLAQHLLGRTIVVDNIDHAIAIARRNHYSLRLVTLDGELLSPGGSMTGGAFKSNSNLLGRRREIEEMTGRLEKRAQRLKSLTGEVEEAHTRRNRLRDEITAVSGLLQKNEYGQSTLRLQLKDLEGRMGETRDARSRIKKEREELLAQKAALEKEESMSGESLEQSGQKEQEINERISRTSEKAGELSKLLSQTDTELSRIRVKLASFSQEKKFTDQNIARLEEELKSRREEAEEISLRLEENEKNRQSRREETLALREQIAKGKEEEDLLQEKLNGLNGRREDIEKEQKSFFDRREELSERNTLLDREIFRLEDQLNRLQENQEKSVAYLWEEYELTPVACRQLRRDDLGSMTAIRKKLSDVRKEIKALGNVNVNAIEEYRELSERHDFLKTQHEDLVKSAADLQKIIADLDQGMREQFRLQFSRIQREFDQTFRELFGGGKGTLELVEDEDILDAGIRVIAQPPGKKLQNMLQLSGGEKSLTAIALLFAIQNLKPSPFCLLDEIESALDEANVERYANYLHKLTRHTQFIIITHRRGSMAAADRLYGITMQEKGVSALVSVDLVKDELDA